MSQTFQKILIANRGEIACRIIKTAQRIGIRCVAVYSEADRQAQHVIMADEAFCIGPAPSSESYLCIDKIITAAKQANADAIHPGYGFLSENRDFALACAQQNIIFIGPSAEAISAMGSKSAAKEIMNKAGIPLVPGYHGAAQDEQTLALEAQRCGYPLLLKATAGGGGKGMRTVTEARDFPSALAAAQREAKNAFGNSDMLIERFLPTPRHIEVQVFCDQYGNAVHLSQRDCSIQRRHQKIVEEAPAPGISPQVCQAMGEAAIAAAKAINYEGAGTIEFLYNEDGTFFFMEMNTRLQVEHPVTELITQIDLVEWQLRVAAGEPLPLTQDQITIKGHAVEVRIYAEDPDNDFLPATGQLKYVRTPNQTQQPTHFAGQMNPLLTNHVRLDTGVVEQDEVSVFYDPMIAKLVTWADDRQTAIQRMSQALAEYRIGGIKQNIPFLYKIMNHRAFHQAQLHTHFIDQHQETLFQQTSAEDLLRWLAIASIFDIHNTTRQSAWRLNQPSRQKLSWVHPVDQVDGNKLTATITTLDNRQTSVYDPEPKTLTYRIEIEGTEFILDVEPDPHQDDGLIITDNNHRFLVYGHYDDRQWTIFCNGSTFLFQQPQPFQTNVENQSENTLSAPMNGRVIAVFAQAGQNVSQGSPLIIVEAMKMEHSILAPFDAVVDTVYFAENDLVSEGNILIALTEQLDHCSTQSIDSEPT